jgi:hypothetical protein
LLQDEPEQILKPTPTSNSDLKATTTTTTTNEPIEIETQKSVDNEPEKLAKSSSKTSTNSTETKTKPNATSTPNINNNQNKEASPELVVSKTTNDNNTYQNVDTPPSIINQTSTVSNDIAPTTTKKEKNKKLSETTSIEESKSTEVNSTNLSAAAGAPVIDRVLALYDFESTAAETIGFPKDAIINILEKSGDWWLGEYNDQIGLLPYNYVKSIGLKETKEG